MICNWSLVLPSLPPPKILLSATSGDILKYLTLKKRERLTEVTSCIPQGVTVQGQI